MAGWRLLLDEPRTAVGQMALDARLAREPRLTVRLFTWAAPAISLGWKQPVPEWLAASTIDTVKRPTGGGLAFHGSDVSVAVIVPRELGIPLASLMRACCGSASALAESYGLDANAVLDAPSAGRITYCLAEVSPYAVMSGQRKLAGFAIRRYPRAWLLQGSLLVSPLPKALTGVLPEEAAASLSNRAVSLSEAAGEALTAAEARGRWAAHWSAWWDAALWEASVHEV